MAFATGTLVIDAPASALNNAGIDQGRADQNVVQVKSIRVKGDRYPYVSAQAFRYWLRTSLPGIYPQWVNAPLYREAENLVYSAADPITYWDDDIFGYMRAAKAGSLTKREQDPEYLRLTPVAREKRNSKEVEVTLTRAAPFRVGTLVSIAPAPINEDQESTSRHEGDPVLFKSQFYRATLRGLFSLDLHACGTFTYINKTGFRNLDEVRINLAKERGAEHLEAEKAYRLSLQERIQRIQALFEGLARLEGGAKQTLHYTDVAPSLVILAVTRGGNHIFNYVVGANAQGKLEMKYEAWRETLRVFANEILSDIYVGWTQGYLDDVRSDFIRFVSDPSNVSGRRILIGHPREIFAAFGRALGEPGNAAWLA